MLTLMRELVDVESGDKAIKDGSLWKVIEETMEKSNLKVLTS